MIYLDYNATSPLMPAVKAAMEALGDAPLNPASIHSAGRLAKKHLEDSRAAIAQAVGAFANEVLFTCSGSEANNMVLRAFAGERPLLVSAVEHASIGKTAGLLGGAVIPVDSNGVVNLGALESMLEALSRPALVSVMLANNESGVIQPMAEISRITHAHGGLVHSDAVQALGKIPVDWGLLGVDMLTLCAHKAGGPVGAGALLIRNDLPIKPLITGGKQELGRRAGTENVHAIVGFAELARQVAHYPDAKKWLAWREWLVGEIKAAAPEAIVCGAGAERLPNTLQITMPGVTSETQLMNFDLAGFAVSAGSACSSGRVAASSVLLAMGMDEKTAGTATRISWGWNSTQADIEAFAEAWKAMYSRLCVKAA
jgi:cysteine desulfurase